MNRSLHAAKVAKQDEFFTQYVDIQKEVEAYLEFDPGTFRDKVVYCNCGDPFESNFFIYFAVNFNKLGLKRLITTSYDGSSIAGQGMLFREYDESNGKRQKPKAIAAILERNKAARIALKGNGKYPGGDFRSPECAAFLEEADIVVTNPPFSMFREYVAQLVEYGKRFLIIGSVNAVSYKEIFKLIKEHRVWLGPSIHGGDREFGVPDDYPLKAARSRIDEQGHKYIRIKGVRWFTNLSYRKRHEDLALFKKYTPEAYPKYDNYDAIEVSKTNEIPVDYYRAMGVPITFLGKYNPDQFEILGITDRGNNSGLKTKKYTKADVPNPGDLNRGAVIQIGNEYKSMYARFLVRRRQSMNDEEALA